METTWRLGSSPRVTSVPTEHLTRGLRDTGAADVARRAVRPRVETALVELMNSLNQRRIPEASCSPRTAVLTTWQRGSYNEIPVM